MFSANYYEQILRNDELNGWRYWLAANRKQRKARSKAQMNYHSDRHGERADRHNLAEYNRYKQIGLGV